MIKIITDSASDISQSEANQLGIKVVPLTIRFNDDEYKDGVSINFDQFYEKLVENAELPKTAQITPFEWEEAINEFPNDEVLIITLSKELSGTYQSACIAAKEFNNVRVINSNNATIGQRLVVYRAISYVNEGKNIDEICALLENEKKEICLLGLLNTLEYLKKGGRISSTVAFIGGMLGIKPVVELKNGKVGLLGTARGSKAGSNKLRLKVEEYNGIDFSRPVVVAYTGNTDFLVNKYIEDSKDLYGDNNLEVHRVGATIGTHIGPGAIAVAFFKNK